MNLIKTLLSKLRSTKHETNSSSGKTFEEMYSDLGVFQYNNEGFNLCYEDFKITLKWAEINRINVYKTDLMTVDRIEMEIAYEEDKVIVISEELPGWYQFVLKTKEVFPSIPEDWDIQILQPPFAANHTTIYKKDH